MNVLSLFARLNLVLLVFMMLGCANLTPVPSPQPVSMPSHLSVVQSVLEQFSTIQEVSPEQVDRQVPEFELAYAQTPNTVNRLRLAVVLGFGRCKQCDSDRSLKLFKETQNANQDATVMALISLSVELLESTAMVAAKKSALLNQQKKVKQLQQKLDDLTSIEESLHLRQ